MKGLRQSSLENKQFKLQGKQEGLKNSQNTNKIGVFIGLFVLLAIAGILMASAAQGAWASGALGLGQKNVEVQEQIGQGEDAHNVLETASFSLEEKLVEKVDKSGKDYGKDIGFLEGVFANFKNAQLTDTKQRIRTKVTLLDESKYRGGQSINELMNSKDDALNSFISQIEYKTSIYDFGDADYYAAKLDVLKENGLAAKNIADIVFARDTYQGQEVQGIIFDSDKGIAYIPKSVVDAYEPSDEAQEQGNILQAQMLCPVDIKIASSINLVKAKLTDVKTGQTQENEIAGDVFSNQSYVQLASVDATKDVDAQSIVVDINNGATVIAGASSSKKDEAAEIKSDTCGAYYDEDTGVLGLNMPVAAISSIDISYSAEAQAFKTLAQNKITPSALPAEMNCVDGATFGNLNLQTLRDYCYSSGNFYFGTAVYVGAGDADDFPGRNTDQVYYPTPLDSSGYVSQSGWDNATDASQYEQIGDRYPAGAAAGKRIAYNMTFLLPEKAGVHEIAVVGKSDMRAACERGDAVGELWTSIEDDGNPIVTDYDWHFADPKPATRMFSAICSHVNNPFSFTADDGICTAYTKIIDINVEQCTITLAFLANLGGDNGGQTCSQVAKFRAIPPKGYIELVKKSANEKISTGNRNYSLAGAEYGVFKDEACTQEVWRLVTNEDGWAKTGEIDVGDYWVKELTPPKGFALDLQTYHVYVNSGAVCNMRSEELPHNNPIEFMIQKHDSDLHGAQAQGEATLAGAEFSIKYYAGYYNSSNLPDEPMRQWVFKTDEKGKVTLDEAHKVSGAELYYSSNNTPCMPLGTVVIQEVKAPNGYLLGDNKPYLQQITETKADPKVESVDVYKAPTFENPVIRGGVEVYKQDKEINVSEALGGKEHTSAKTHAALSGITFEITNKSKDLVYVEDQTYAPGRVVKTITTVWDDEHHAYRAATSTDCLPFGRYAIAEVATNDSYLLSDGAPREFAITDDGQFASFDNVFENQIVRNDLRLQKKADGSSQALSFVPFALTHTGTGETHILVTDENGYIDTANGIAKHTDATNSFDALLSSETTNLTLSDVKGCISEEKTLTRASIEACGVAGQTGTWFGLGEHGSMAEADNSLAALPYGEYLLYELPCEANKGLVLFSTQLRIYADVSVFARGYDLGTVINYSKPQPPEISTSATDKADGDKYITADKSACVIDTVTYKNLEVGTSYRLEGTIMDKETEKPLSVADETVSASLEFEAIVSNGQIGISYDFDSSALAGKELVVFEKLYCGDELLVAHEDLRDAEQTVRVLSLETSARNGDVEGKADTENRIVPAGNVHIIDTLMYKGLEAGKTYKAYGMLMSKETGLSLKTQEGDDVSAETEFVAEESSGTAEVAFSADTSDLAGKDVVVYEKLYDDSGNEVLQHEDLANEQQTVSVEETPPTQETPPDSFTPEPTPAVAQTQQASNNFVKTGDNLQQKILALVALALLALLILRIVLHFRAKEKDKLRQGDMF